MSAQTSPTIAFSRRALSRKAATLAVAAILLGCAENVPPASTPPKVSAPDRVPSNPQLIAAGENLLSARLTDQDRRLLAANTNGVLGSFDLGEARLEDGSTLFYHVDSESERVWGYSVRNARKLRWADCPEAGRCETGPGETFAHHFFGLPLDDE